MRRVRKGEAPRNVAPEGQAAKTLQQAEMALREGLKTAEDPAEHARKSHFDVLNKKALRKNLLADQAGLCVFCETGLRDRESEEVVARGDTRIAHWTPIRHKPELALTWRNLYLSCGAQHTCDRSQGDRVLSGPDGEGELPWPADKDYERCLGIGRDGRMYVRRDAPLDGAQRQALALALGRMEGERSPVASTLNLNHPALIEARKAAIDAQRKELERTAKGKTLSETEREERAGQLQKQAFSPSFLSARLAYLRRELGKHRSA